MVSALDRIAPQGERVMKRLVAMIFLTIMCLAACTAPVPEDSKGMLAAEFVGLADSHTIEVTADGGALTLQLEGDAREQAQDFEKGDAVYIRYERRDGVLYAQSIELAPPAQ
jgi:hypothetical protein